MKLHELSSSQIIALKLTMVRMGIWEGDLDGNFSLAFGHAFNRMQNRLGVEVNSQYTDETDAALKAFFQFTTGGDWTWDINSGGVVDQSGMLVGEWAEAATDEVTGDWPDNTPPDPEAPDVDEEELPDEQGMTPEKQRDYRAQAMSYLNQYGLGTKELIDLIDVAIQEGWSAATFEQEVKNSDSFKARFPYYETLNQRGSPMSIAQIVDYERGVLEALHRYGLSDIYQIPDNAFGGNPPASDDPNSPFQGSPNNTTGPPPDYKPNDPSREEKWKQEQANNVAPTMADWTTGPPPGYTGNNWDNLSNEEKKAKWDDYRSNNPPASGNNGGGQSEVSGLPAIVGSEVQDLIENLIESDVSIAELNERLGRGYATVFNQDPAIQQFFASAYGVQGEAALAAYFLDPDMDAEVLFDRAETAVLGGTSTMAFGDETINLFRAERMQSVGISQARAWQAFTQINELGALFTETIGEQADFTKSEEGTDALLGLTPEGMRTLERRRRSRVAGFSGGGGFAAGQEGITGFGTSSS